MMPMSVGVVLCPGAAGYIGGAYLGGDGVGGDGVGGDGVGGAYVYSDGVGGDGVGGAYVYSDGVGGDGVDGRVGSPRAHGHTSRSAIVVGAGIGGLAVTPRRPRPAYAGYVDWYGNVPAAEAG